MPLSKIFDRLINDNIEIYNNKYDEKLFKVARDIVLLKLSFKFIFPPPESFSDLSMKKSGSYLLMKRMKENQMLFKSLKRDGNELAIYLELLNTIKNLLKRNLVDYITIASLDNMEYPGKLLSPDREVWLPALQNFFDEVDKVLDSGVPIFPKMNRIKPGS